MPARSSNKKSTKKPTARRTQSTRTTRKKNQTRAAGVRQSRARMTEALRAAGGRPQTLAETQTPPPSPNENLATSAPPRAASSPQAELSRILDSAKRLGVEVKPEEAIRWLTAITAIQNQADIVVNVQDDIFGGQVAMLDFSPADLAHFRRIGKIVAIPDQPGVLETALAISGSAAQSKIQTYPGDADYLQRVNIKAPTLEDAQKILSDAMLAHARATLRGPDHQMIRTTFGTLAEVAIRDGNKVKPGFSLTWWPPDIEKGEIQVETLTGEKKTVRWEDTTAEGWCKFDWVVADAQRGQLANASNLLDVTWEAPDGTITSLDGVIDPYFQEVYLDASAVPVFSKLVKHVSTDALQKYVHDLEGEVYKYLVQHPNYGKVAKRSYNIFRMTGRYPEAAYLRELFDEPTTALYQVAALFETLAEAETPDSAIDREAMLKQYDRLIETVIKNTSGDAEMDIVRALMLARDNLIGVRKLDEDMEQVFAAPTADVMKLLNAYFKERLYVMDSICEYLEQIQQRKVE